MSPFKYQKSCVSPASFSLSNQIHYPWKVWPKFRYCLPGFHSSYHQLVLSCKQSLRAQAIHNNPTGKKKVFGKFKTWFTIFITTLFQKSIFCPLKNRQKCRIKVLQFWHFPPIFVLFKVTCLVTLFGQKLRVFKNSPKMDHFWLINFCP